MRESSSPLRAQVSPIAVSTPNTAAGQAQSPAPASASASGAANLQPNQFVHKCRLDLIEQKDALVQAIAVAEGYVRTLTDTINSNYFAIRDLELGFVGKPGAIPFIHGVPQPSTVEAALGASQHLRAIEKAAHLPWVTEGDLQKVDVELETLEMKLKDQLEATEISLCECPPEHCQNSEHAQEQIRASIDKIQERLRGVKVEQSARGYQRAWGLVKQKKRQLRMDNPNRYLCSYDHYISHPAASVLDAQWAKEDEDDNDIDDVLHIPDKGDIHVVQDMAGLERVLEDNDAIDSKQIAVVAAAVVAATAAGTNSHGAKGDISGAKRRHDKDEKDPSVLLPDAKRSKLS
jgi:hypothetical protein